MQPLIRSHKITLDPTCKQKVYLSKACGTARFAWNWALGKWEEKYKKGEKPNALELKKEFNSLKKEHFPWTYEVTKYASQQPFIYLQRAFVNFFAKRARYPKYKKKGKNDSFYIGGDQLFVVGTRVKIPNLGWVRLRESLRFSGKITGATVSQRAGVWSISIHVETDQKPTPCKSHASVGVDLGIKTYATLSDGLQFPSNRPLKKKLKRLRRLSRCLSRKSKGSKNRLKAKRQVAKLHYKIACSRSDAIHKLTTHLTDNYEKIVIEDLAVSDMLKNRKLARAIVDGGWSEFRRQLCYKAAAKGNRIFIADRWYASSKRCSSCGSQKDQLSLSERVYSCTNCQTEIDRDLNAAICLKQLLDTASSAEINACGQDGSVIMLKTSSQPAWQKQELSRV